MISIEDSIPSKSDTYRIGEDVFFFQFNDVSFYVEDEEQENFFFCILKRLFPEIRIERIFPLGGKDNVIEEAEKNQGDKKKVFIVDKDFDDLLNKIVHYDNLFYLDRYSIENYLLEQDAFINYIISEKPKLKRANIENQLNIETCLTDIFNVLKELVYLHIIVQNKCSQIKNVSLNHERFVRFINNSFETRNDQINNYKQYITNELSKIDRRLTLMGQMRSIKKIVLLKTNANCMIHVPGKYTIKMLKQMIESLFGLSSRNTESFSYHIAEKSEFISLQSLKEQVESFIE